MPSTVLFNKMENMYFKSNRVFATFMQYTMGMHIVSTRYLKCPHCKTRTWCRKVMTKE